MLAAHLPEHHWVYGANLDMDASYRDPSGRLVNRRRQFGTMILSRLPIVSSRNHLLPKYATLTQHSIQQGALEAVIVTPRGGTAALLLDAPEPFERARHDCRRSTRCSRSTRARQPRAARGAAATRIRTRDGPRATMPPMPADAILMGDFNFDWDTAEYERIVGPTSRRSTGDSNRVDRIRRRVGRRRAPRGRRRDDRRGRRIDYCFVSATLAKRVRSAWVDSDATGSDHWPLWLDIDL